MMRIAMSIMDELEAGLLELDDFELLVTHLKVTPARWGLAMLRKVREVQASCCASGWVETRAAAPQS